MSKYKTKPERQASVITDVHHRKPKSQQGSNEDRNKSVVKTTQHVHWHGLFGNRSPQQIARYINSVWLDPDFKFIVVKKNNDN